MRPRPLSRRTRTGINAARGHWEQRCQIKPNRNDSQLADCPDVLALVPGAGESADAGAAVEPVGNECEVVAPTAGDERAMQLHGSPLSPSVSGGAVGVAVVSVEECSGDSVLGVPDPPVSLLPRVHLVDVEADRANSGVSRAFVARHPYQPWSLPNVALTRRGGWTAGVDSRCRRQPAQGVGVGSVAGPPPVHATRAKIPPAAATDQERTMDRRIRA